MVLSFEWSPESFLVCWGALGNAVTSGPECTGTCSLSCFRNSFELMDLRDVDRILEAYIRLCLPNRVSVSVFLNFQHFASSSAAPLTTSWLIWSWSKEESIYDHSWPLSELFQYRQYTCVLQLGKTNTSLSNTVSPFLGSWTKTFLWLPLADISSQPAKRIISQYGFQRTLEQRTKHVTVLCQEKWRVPEGQ